MPLPFIIAGLAVSVGAKLSTIGMKTEDKTFKIAEVYIQQHKMFKDLLINFIDFNNKKTLPIVVLAGKNGTGKTTLLEYLANYTAEHNHDYISISNDIDGEIKLAKMKKGEDGIIEARKEYKKKLKYIKADVNNVDNIEVFISDYYIDLAEKIDSFSKALKKLQNFIKESFQDLDLDFNVSKIDYKRKKVFFKKENSNVEFDIEELSTGEKTLVSKVLVLFFKQFKNKIILIDEPELSLHPSWQNKVLKIYENFALKNNCQIIIATHSPHIIASAKNEYLRILRKNEEGNIEVVNDLKAHGRDINSILFEVMGEVAYRPKEFEEKIDRLHIAIDEKKIEEAKERLEALKKDYGENDEVVMEAQILIDMFSRNEE